MTARTHPPLWVFALLPIAGASMPFTGIAMPFLLRSEGISVGTISIISGFALGVLPFTLILAPLADMLLSRRNWVLVANLVLAVLLFIAIELPRPQHLGLFTVLLALANVCTAIISIAINGLMAALVPDRLRGKVSGWCQLGNMGSIAFLGGACLWLIQRLPLSAAAAAIAVLSFAPALAALLIDEPARSLAPSRALFGAMFREVAALLKKRQTWLGLLIFLAPFTGAAQELFSGVGVDYHASPGMVEWVTGIPAGIVVFMCGAFVGGLIADRVPRRAAYPALAILLAGVACAMALGPLTPATYAAGCLAYEFVMAASWAAGTALMLELAGSEHTSAATRVALFAAAQTAPMAYMVWVDGRGYQAWGVRGLLGTDALLACASAVGLLLLCARLWHARSHSPASTLTGEGAS